MDNITKIVNDFKTIGANLVNTIGPTVSMVAGGIASFTESLSKSPGLIQIITGLLAGLAARSFVAAIGSIFTTFAKIPFGLGIPLAIGAIAMMRTEASGARNIASAQEGGITTQEGLVNVHPQEAIVPIEKLGGMIADAMKPVVEENRRMRQQNDTLIAETRRQAGRFAEAMESIA